MRICTQVGPVEAGAILAGTGPGLHRSYLKIIRFGRSIATCHIFKVCKRLKNLKGTTEVYVLSHEINDSMCISAVGDFGGMVGLRIWDRGRGSKLILPDWSFTGRVCRNRISDLL
jgi:hypothetical protein